MSQQYIFTILPPGYTNSSALCHNLVHISIICLTIPKNIMLYYCLVDIMLIESGEKFLKLSWISLPNV